MFLLNTDLFWNQPDHDHFYKIKIPGFCKIRLAITDHLLDLMYRHPAAGIPILLKECLTD